MDNWYIEGYLGNQKTLNRLPLNLFPFLIGWQEGLSLTIHSDKVSRTHAEINLVGNRLILKDKGSANGTFVNREQMRGEMKLAHGDVIHFGTFETRLIKETINTGIVKSMTKIGHNILSNELPTGIRELQEMLSHRSVSSVYQPIVETISDKVFAYEVLGRGNHPSLSVNPGPLFRIAESFGRAVELSELFREHGVATAASFPFTHRYFLNIHPQEMSDSSRLLKSMELLRNSYPKLPLVLEVHEQAVSDISTMKKFNNELKRMGIELAYDDFGSGQSRLMELIEAPATYLKFDIALVGKIESGPDSRREMVALLVEMAHKMGIKTLAEGLDSKGDAEACKKLGFDYIQGYYYGYPEPKIGV